MTIQSVNTRLEATGDGSTTTFVVRYAVGGSFQNIFVQDEAHLVVYLDNVLKTLGTDYSVNLSNNTAEVVFSSAPASGAKILVYRELPFTQPTDYINNDIFDAETLENALDRLTQQVQQVKDIQSRGIRLSNSVFGLENISLEISQESDDRANKVIAFDNSGNVNIGQEIGSYLGAWSGSTSYVRRDIIKDDLLTLADNSTNLKYGTIYICLNDHTSGNVTRPFDDANYDSNWAVLVDAEQFATKAEVAQSASTNAGDWANKIDGPITGTTEYSAKAYAVGGTGVDDGAGSAKDWATKTSGVVGGTSLYGAKYYAEASASSATDADTAKQGAETALSAFQGQYKVGDTDPYTTKDNGDLWYDTSIGSLRFWNASANSGAGAWESLNGIATISAQNGTATGTVDITFTLQDGTTTTVTTPDLTGPQGPQGIQGVAGADGTDGTNGTGFTGGSYDSGAGTITFTSNDGLGFSTGDLRGENGVGITTIAKIAENQGQITIRFSKTDNTNQDITYSAVGASTADILTYAIALG